MFEWRSIDEWKRLWRYYQAGIVNLLFGFSLYAILIRFGINLYLAQILSHVIGAVFNYLTYSRYTFAGSQSSKVRFAVSYIGNYFLGLVALAAFSQIVSSAYLAGFLSSVAVSFVNFFILKHLVFTVGQRQ